MRIEHAKHLLLTSDHSKRLAIAEESGFSTEQTFYRNFRKFTGMKPTEWLRLNQKA